METKKCSFKKNAIYNTVGTLIGSFCLWLTTLVVVRLSSDYGNAGTWQLTISVSNIFMMIAMFNLPTFMVSDTGEDRLSPHYIGAQLIACLTAFVLCLVYCLLCAYRGATLHTVLVYVLDCCLCAFLSILHAVEQRRYRMDFVGISRGVRGVLEVLLFTLLLYFTSRVDLAAWGMIAAALVMLVFYDAPHARRFASLKPSFSAKTFSLLKTCLPTVAAGAAFIAISTVPRQALQALYGDEVLGYYATAATPVVVVQTLSLSIFAPLLRDLALYYKQGEARKIRQILQKIALITAVLTALGMAAVALVGEFAWTLVYGEAIRPYCYLLYGVLGYTVLYVLCQICSNLLIVMRKARAMLILSVAALLLTVLLVNPLICRFYMQGVSYAIMAGYLLYLICSTIVIRRGMKRRGKTAPV